MDGSSVSLIAWLIAGVCFILSLSGLSQHETSRRGNWLGIIGISIAIVATLFSGQIGKIISHNADGHVAESTIDDAEDNDATDEDSELLAKVSHSPNGLIHDGAGLGGYFFLILALAGGGAIGIYFAQRVEMTEMPQLVAILHSFVGLAAVLVGLSNHFIHWDHDPNIVHKVEIFLGILIGGYTFVGSVIAYGKLDGRIDSTPLIVPNRHLINIGMAVFCVLLLLWYISAGPGVGTLPLILVTIISGVLGWHMIMAIGGADMPVVVSMLNSYSGWAAAAIGFLLPNDLLIVTGALVGSSGAILSYIMCAAMNRSFVSVILGGFGQGTGGAAAKSTDDGVELSYNTTSAEETAQWLMESDEVVVVPGYGMAVAQAQHSVREICEALKQKGINTRFAIHPVAGRLPGHMNVLLAEAKVPYDIVLEMDEINEDFESTGTVLVIGANDIVNPGALDDESSPIYGMPVLECWHAEHTVVLKRSMGTGYSGVDNPLFYLENSAMLFGDAKASVDAILQGIRDAS